MVDKGGLIYVAGHNGMVGSAIVRQLVAKGCDNIITRSRSELDLLDQQAVRRFFENNNIQQVFLAAARVGGIHANNVYPAEFIYQNLTIQNNIIHSAHLTEVNKLLFLGSSCIYPKFATQPMAESEILTGPLEPTNEPYAIAKIAGIKMCESYARQYGRDYRSVMPTNLYGPGDNYHPENSHVIPGLLRRFHEAKLANAESVIIWGSGSAKREFLYVDDMAEACCYVMDLDHSQYSTFLDGKQSHINIGTGIECSIKELAQLIKEVSGFQGNLEFDTSKADGTPRKLLDVSKLNQLGWQHKTSLKEGLKTALSWYETNVAC